MQCPLFGIEVLEVLQDPVYVYRLDLILFKEEVQVSVGVQLDRLRRIR
jgi:hypothetical protein